jgi:ABC-type enterochelin transport system permease subunit
MREGSRTALEEDEIRLVAGGWARGDIAAVAEDDVGIYQLCTQLQLPLELLAFLYSEELSLNSVLNEQASHQGLNYSAVQVWTVVSQ